MGERWERVRDYKPKHYQLVWAQLIFAGGITLCRYHNYNGIGSYHVHLGDRIIPESQVEAWQPATLPIY